MPLPRRPIQQLQLDPNFTWVLDSFGGLVISPRGQPQESVECIITPCVPNPANKSGLTRHLGRQKIGTVGINSLGLLQLGQCVQHGKFVANPINSPLEVVSFRFDSRTLPDSHELYLDQVRIDPKSALINGWLSQSGVNSAVKLIDGELLKTDRKDTPDTDASPYDPRPFKVLFHELEIIRFYYTNSAHLNGAVFGGDFSEDRLYKRVVSRVHQGPHYELPSRAARFEYQLGFNTEDAILLGRILFEDPSAALEGVRRIYQSMLVSRINEVSPIFTGYPRTKFPFKQKAVLKIQGRRIRMADGQYLFVAHRIVECNAKFPFEDLSFQCAIEPGGPPAPVDAEPAFANKKSQTGPGLSDGVIDTEARPASDSLMAASIEQLRRFSSLVVSRCKTRKDRDSTHSSAEQKPPVFNPELENSSAGAPTWGQTNAVRLDVSDKIVGMGEAEELDEEDKDEPKVANTSVDLKTFQEILDHLRSSYGDHSIKPVAIRWGDVGEEDALIGEALFSVFPIVPCPLRKSMNRQFSFMDKARSIRRPLICVSLEVSGRLFYLLEAERRLNEESKPIEELPILLVWGPNFQTVGLQKLRSLLEETVTNPSKTWPLDTAHLDLNQRRIDHDQMRETDVVANRLVEVVASICGPASTAER